MNRSFILPYSSLELDVSKHINEITDFKLYMYIFSQYVRSMIPNQLSEIVIFCFKMGSLMYHLNDENSNLGILTKTSEVMSIFIFCNSIVHFSVFQSKLMKKFDYFYLMFVVFILKYDNRHKFLA